MPTNDVSTPPRSSPPWGDVSWKSLGKHRSTRASRVVAKYQDCSANLVLNTPPRRQAPRWEDGRSMTETRTSTLNLVPFRASRMVAKYEDWSANLVLNTPPRRQAPRWEDGRSMTETRTSTLNLVPFGLAPVERGFWTTPQVRNRLTLGYNAAQLRVGPGGTRNVDIFT